MTRNLCITDIEIHVIHFNDCVLGADGKNYIISCGGHSILMHNAQGKDNVEIIYHLFHTMYHISVIILQFVIG